MVYPCLQEQLIDHLGLHETDLVLNSGGRHGLEGLNLINRYFLQYSLSVHHLFLVHGLGLRLEFSVFDSLSMVDLGFLLHPLYSLLF